MPADIKISPSILSAGEAVLLAEDLQQPQHWPTLPLLLLLLLQPQMQHPPVSYTTERHATIMRQAYEYMHMSMHRASDSSSMLLGAETAWVPCLLLQTLLLWAQSASRLCSRGPTGCTSMSW